MAYSIILTKRASKDLRETVDYLDNQKRQFFLTELTKCVDIIAHNPKAFPLAFSKFRKMVMPNTPYNIYYTTKDRKKEIVIVRVWHQKKNPKTLGLK